MRTTIFISDLHLSVERAKIVALWHKFARSITQNGANNIDALYILGDFFTLWVGDDDLSSFNLAISRTLQEIAHCGTKIYFLPGNRDFMLGEDFAQRSGCVLLREPAKIDIYGVPTLLLHGDILCTKDRVMRVFRWITRSNWCKKLFLSFPLTWRQWIAQRVRSISARRQRSDANNEPAKILEIDGKIMLELLQQYGAQQVIHGHVHRAGVYTVQNGKDNAKKEQRRVVLDEWTEEGGNVLFCYEDGRCETLKITPN